MFTYIAKINNVDPLADEIGHFTPASRAADVVVRERDAEWPVEVSPHRLRPDESAGHRDGLMITCRHFF